ncbi:hypothetical protein BpHYR1_018810 [Brachionus plicatilis]|uniref:Uncharacterized protein n=1 Tax=Brachionus plicatilis TaxID=10195 RepID=A0A3M7SVG5_BRAPC|nr:hypothetical protein BpHYR1_018810 [Brachionus plicatilis]
MLVFHVKDVKTGFVEIVFQRVSNKIIHFIDQTVNFWFFILAPFSTIVTCRISRKRKPQLGRFWELERQSRTYSTLIKITSIFTIVQNKIPIKI